MEKLLLEKYLGNQWVIKVNDMKNDKAEITILAVLAVLAIIVVGVVVVGVMLYWGAHNGLIEKSVAVEKVNGDLQSQYQRRADLIPNLVSVVTSSAKFESKTQTEIAGLRSQAISGQQMMKNAKTVEDIQSANNVIDNTLSRLMVVVEAYPQLRTTESYQTLMAQLEGTENRINYARNEYNAQAQDYKTYCSTLPTSIISGIDHVNCEKWPMYQAKTANADVAPVIPTIDI
jgi:LemA protein